MSGIQAITTTTGQTIIEEATVNELKSALRGQLLRAGDEGYDQTRRVHNAMIDRRPAMIARCAGATDVIECVRFARKHQLLVSVRAAGHNVVGSAICDGGLVIDLSGMKAYESTPGHVRRVWRVA